MNKISLISGGAKCQYPMTSLNPTLTIGEQIAESLIIHKNLSKKNALDQAWQLLELVGIPSAKTRLNEYPFQLSGGMRQRVMIAIGIATEPKIIFADEPTTALDVTIQAQIMDLLERLRLELKSSIILITHDIGLVAGFAKNILVMYAGRIIEMSESEELFESPQHPYTKGLLGSLPNPSTQGQELLSIPGVVPTPEYFPKGCRFHPRCEYAKDICKVSPPPLAIVSPCHRVACWLFCDHE